MGQNNALNFDVLADATGTHSDLKRILFGKRIVGLRTICKDEIIWGGKDAAIYHSKAAPSGASFLFDQANKINRWEEFVECPYEDLVDPSRVHLDSFGNVHICQGISIGNFLEKPLSEIFSSYQPESHPICGALLRGGPASLIKELGLDPEEGYVDECHACYLARREKIDQYPDYLTPRQVYGLE